MKKFETIIESYLNGNISWVKAEVKKLSKAKRKELYNYAEDTYHLAEMNAFFYNLI